MCVEQSGKAIIEDAVAAFGFVVAEVDAPAPIVACGDGNGVGSFTQGAQRAGGKGTVEPAVIGGLVDFGDERAIEIDLDILLAENPHTQAQGIDGRGGVDLECGARESGMVHHP